jgi:hypothetical protein
MAEEIKGKRDLYKIGSRKVLYLNDPDSLDEVNQFLKDSRSFIKSTNGWIFISHRGVARGLDLNGVAAARMIVNFRFANYTELIQTLGRANRNPFEHKPEGSSVFVDGPGIPTLSELSSADQSNLCEAAITKLFAGILGISV